MHISSLLGPSLLNIPNGPVVSLDYGDFLGLSTATTINYLGIPYAKPPVGDLRFNPPQAPSYLGSQSAKEYGNSCLQVDQTFNLTLSEDCLNLNVYAPSHATPESNLPVMVYIYGGGFTVGSSAIPLYDGKFIIDAGGDVIVVTINYRVGVFGFLSASQSTSNAGLLDQKMGNGFLL
jgi:carboxylesterase type B